ncbi:unnamed protein product (macronuclear) [Paramecium tetraurelia]|uniref:Alpha-tubulin N-acetyltransferase n=1 Tax=Paramecium tetraurelia TaxID=5888 RepID=A0CF38_PARTE|nr:uncharacterized protein GSPATT00037844001 [Paramecium tetraurelia]CAK69405.1 unnamed protein product [Paramecium tetraurelia]|eukprot:XP_001436802.1 hypothetical protein (macronuclear) [Paramecium tetraurelia strain d4-2]
MQGMVYINSLKFDYMQFNFYLSKCMPVNENGITILNGNQNRNPQLDDVITIMGEASALAQNLRQLITSPTRFFQTDQKLYIKSEGKQCFGILKIGRKNLFHRDLNGAIIEIQPLCVLDFYVHESVQRRGIGKELFEEMLRQEMLRPEKLAYDRPSPKLLGFIKKYYNLSSYIPQNNNYIIYSQYFDFMYTNVAQQQSAQQSYQQQQTPQLVNQYRIQQQQTPLKMEQLDQMMQQMSLESKQQYSQYQKSKAQPPWVTDQQQYQNMYQTTTGLMSAQIQRR